MGGTDIAFTADGLRDGGRLASATADAAGAVAGQIAAIPIGAAVFGQLPEAAALTSSLTVFRDSHAELGHQVQAVHAGLAGRATGVAGAGDGMVNDTTAQAGRVPLPAEVRAVSPATIDLSLPSDGQLLAAASPNPEVEAAKITATGNPGQVADLGHRLQRSGAELDQVYQQSMKTQQVLGGSFANDGASVYDAQTHRDALPAGFADAGTRLHDGGRRVAVLALELGSAIDDVNAAQSGLFEQLDSRRRSFAAEVDGARGAGGLIPEARVPALQARRASVTASMQDLVNTCGRDVGARVDRYGTLLAGCRQLLTELALPGTLSAGGRFPGARLEGGTVPGSVLGTTLPAPVGTPTIVDPLPPRLPLEPGFTPDAGGLGPLITPPAPELDNGVVDGPGSGQRDTGPPFTIDRSAPTGDEPDDDFEGTGFTRDEVEQFINGHTDDGNPVLERPPERDVAETLDNGTRTDHDNSDGTKSAQYDYVVRGRPVRIYVNPRSPWDSTAFYRD